MKTLTFKFHSDPGHGWLEVPQTLIMQLGLVDKISHYSYFKDNTAYLEEDGDAGIFLDALKLNKDIKVEFDEISYNNESKIRSYPSY